MYLSVSSGAIRITDVTDVTSMTKRRKLFAADSTVKIEFIVEINTISDMAILESKLVTNANVTELRAQLIAANIFVSKVVAPTSIATLAPPPTPPPQTSSDDDVKDVFLSSAGNRISLVRSIYTLAFFLVVATVL